MREKAKKLKVLISAYACEPGRGSEPAVGWNMVAELSKLHDVWVVTNYIGRESIDEHLAKEERFKVCYFDMPGLLARTSLLGRSAQCHYYAWQLAVIKTMRQLHDKIGFDICHHVTYVKYWAPAGIAWVDAPMIWGPVGGAEPMPKGFLKSAPLRAKFFEWTRLLMRLMSHIDPFVRKAAMHASLAIAVTPETKEAIGKLNPSLRVQLMTQIGVQKTDTAPVSTKAQDFPCRNDHCVFIYVGNLIHWKGVHLGLKAFANANRHNSEFWIIGEGEEKKRLVKLCQKLGVEKQVKFLGRMSYVEVQDSIQRASCLVHTSLHDSGGFVLVEAMAHARPVICLDTAGPKMIVKNDVGIKVPISDENATCEAIAAAMQTICDSPDVAKDMGLLGRGYIEKELTWSKKAARISGLYRMVVSHSDEL